MKKAEFISYSKGIAILGIMLFHLISGYFSFIPILGKAVSFGGAGVHVFILCSGFGLMYSHILKPLSFVNFIKKRFWKVYIPYLIVVIIAFLLPNVYGGFDRIPALLSHIFLFKMFVPAYTATFGYQFWYISTIIQFYFAFIFLAKTLEKLGKKNFVIISCIISFIWAVLVALLGFSEIRVWNSFFLQYLWEFAIGMVLACEYAENNSIRLEQVSVPKLIVFTVVSFGLYSVLSLLGGFLKLFNDPFSLAAFGGMCLLMYKCNIFNRFVYFTSGISYEIYLTHVLIFKLFFEILIIPIPLFLLIIITIATVYLLSWLYNMLCKKILYRII